MHVCASVCVGWVGGWGGGGVHACVMCVMIADRCDFSFFLFLKHPTCTNARAMNKHPREITLIWKYLPPYWKLLLKERICSHF